jgi:LDH2 family malate/lactate/ureidoglycolate dehydrogenase
MPENMPGKGLGHFFGAMRIDAFRKAEEFKHHMDNWIKRFKNATPINENQKVLIPGEPEFAAEKKRLQNGIPLHTSVAADLAALANEFKIDF